MKRIFLATAIALLALPALAQASTCQRVGSAVAVHMSGSTDVATLSRVGSDIYNGVTPCDGATVFNTSAIFILDTTPNRDGQDFVGIDLSGGPFAAGTASAKNGQVPEIGIQLDLQHGAEARPRQLQAERRRDRHRRNKSNARRVSFRVAR